MRMVLDMGKVSGVEGEVWYEGVMNGVLFMWGMVGVCDGVVMQSGNFLCLPARSAAGAVKLICAGIPGPWQLSFIRS